MYSRVCQRVALRTVIALIICIALLPISGASFLVKGLAGQGQAVGHAGRPKPGKPEGSLPNLDDMKAESQLEREMPWPISSTMRSQKNSGIPWDGRRVGDPSSEKVGQANRTERGMSTSAARLRDSRSRRAHAFTRASSPPVYDDQFVPNFFTWALARTPFSNESAYWYDHLRVAHGDASTSLKLAAVEFGRTLFESAEYAARNRNAHWYVYDLYKTYLMREPDAGGWATWEATVATHGREYVRRGFEESTEFATLISNMLPNGTASSSAASLISARVNPRNQPANGLLTRDTNWSVSLLQLPGRSGLDLGLTLSYSSMVWTRSGPYIYFDEDNSFPSPGFRLGFPTVQRKVFDAQTARNSYLMVTPAGNRVELRQVGTSNIYDAADSSYLRLTDNGATLVVQSTDGTRLTFSDINWDYRCTEIKDRNGNYISVNYNSLGQITSVVDTLGRGINFNYDVNANLLSITQSWAGQSHLWVSFGWGTRTMQYSFSDSTLRGVIGIANGTTLPVITQVALNDTSHFTFDYTNSLQLSLVRNYFGTLERNSATFTYETPAGDAPRLLDSRVSARNWTGYNNVPAQVITQYSVGGDGAGILTAPDGTIYKEYYGTGWQMGLITSSEVWSGGVRKKWTTIAWTQDDTNLSYPKNPRPYDTSVYDDQNNRRRTEVIYTSYNLPDSVALPTEVKEYAANGTTVLRRATTTYFDGGQPYIDRRVLGLTREVIIYDGSNQPQSKVWYDYDWGNDYWAATPHPAIQHDASGVAAGRGNLCWVGRWDVSDINNFSKVSASYTKYNRTGSVIRVENHYGIGNTLSYTDSFSDSSNRNTFAYPTTVTDGDGFSSSVQYNFDLGATTRTQSPTPAGQSQGAIQTMTYNTLGQLERITTTNNGAYKRLWYGADYTASYTTVNNVADELYSITVTDGLGRTIGAVNNHPGSNGGYSLVNTVYNLMGRTWLRSNPTEVNSSWTPAGDDAAGIYHTQQTYDWQGRPLVTTHPDGTTKEASYSGCGCAGGAVITLTDEGTLDAGVAKRRQQRIYSDVLGRTVKVELLNWQNGTVYSTTVNSYNGRDQVIQSRQYAGPEGGGSFQDTVLTYDGHGRLKTKHVPEHSTGTAVSWIYNADDTIQSTTDPRGATATFTYNNRQKPTAVTYTLSGSSTMNTLYGYDAAGNRTSMTDSLGNVIYGYDQLSRMTSEVRYYATPNRSYTLTYDYNLKDQLTSVSYPGWSQQVGYIYDTAGRLTTVTGSGFVTGYYQGTWPNWTWIQHSVTSFASNITYRASNSVKQMGYGNGLQMAVSYNARLRMTQYQLSNFASSSNLVSNYEYYNDGKIKYAGRTDNNVFDRAFTYDHAGRMKEALTGSEARGGSTQDGPYRESYSYDVWGNTVSQTSRLWTESPVTTNSTYVNNCNQNWAYDANGFVIFDNNNGYQTDYEYDVAGRRNEFVPWFATVGGLFPAVEFAYEFDGDGRSAKQLDTRRGEDPEFGVYSVTTASYYLHSAMLGGQVVAELDAQGNKSTSHVYVEGMRIATETIGGWPSGAIVKWQYTDPVTGSKGSSNIARDNSGTTELSTFGADVTYAPPSPDPQSYQQPIYIEPVKQTYYEIEGGPTASYGVDSWYTNMVNKDFDRHMAEVYWRHGFRDWAMAIVANNPNVGVLSRHYDLNGNLTSIGLRWGTQAAGFLMGTHRDIESGSLLDANTEQYGEVVGYKLDQPQDPPPPVPTPGPERNPCRKWLASELDYDVVRTRGKDANGNIIREKGIEHITRRHILVDSGQFFLTPSQLPIAAQGASKYVFQDNVKTVSEAQGFVKELNARIFEAAKSDDHAWSWSHGNIVMTVVFPVVPSADGGYFAGIGFDRKRGFGAPTNAATLVLANNCKDVITSYPGKP